MKNISYPTVLNIYYNERREFYEECAKLFRNFSDMNEDDKLKNIMSHKCWKITLRYVNSLWEKRKSLDYV